MRSVVSRRLEALGKKSVKVCLACTVVELSDVRLGTRSLNRLCALVEEALQKRAGDLFDLCDGWLFGRSVDPGVDETDLDIVKLRGTRHKSLEAVLANEFVAIVGVISFRKIAMRIQAYFLVHDVPRAAIACNFIRASIRSSGIRCVEIGAGSSSGARNSNVSLCSLVVAVLSRFLRALGSSL